MNCVAQLHGAAEAVLEHIARFLTSTGSVYEDDVSHEVLTDKLESIAERLQTVRVSVVELDQYSSPPHPCEGRDMLGIKE